jgi:MFS-type transporter involved in bile tolerance (Atg22 family)
LICDRRSNVLADRQIHEIESHKGKMKDCSKECWEVGKLKRHITAIYIVLAFLVVAGIIMAFKFEGMVVADTSMKTQIEANSKRLDVQRTDINRQDDRIDELVKGNGAKRK